MIRLSLKRKDNIEDQDLTVNICHIVYAWFVDVIMNWNFILFLGYVIGVYYKPYNNKILKFMNFGGCMIQYESITLVCTESPVTN